MQDPNRGTGRTTKQMQEAPHGAVFVWCNQFVDYARNLAGKLGRTDLKVVSPRWLEEPDRVRGLELTGLVLDHAVRLTERQAYGLEVVLPRIRVREVEQAAPESKLAKAVREARGGPVPVQFKGYA